MAVDVTLAEVELVAEVRPVDGARLVAAAVALLAHLHDPLLDLLAIRAVEQCLRLHRLRDPPPRLLRVESWRRWIVEADPANPAQVLSCLSATYLLKMLCPNN